MCSEEHTHFRHATLKNLHSVVQPRCEVDFSFLNHSVQQKQKVNTEFKRSNCSEYSYKVETREQNANRQCDAQMNKFTGSSLLGELSKSQFLVVSTNN